MSYYHGVRSSILAFLAAFYFILVSYYACCIISPAHAARPVDTLESTRASPFRRIVSGVNMAFDMLLRMVDPSNFVHEAKEFAPTRMQVYFVGLGRTGTTSLAEAMSILGYTVLHDDTGMMTTDLYKDFYDGRIDEDELNQKIGERGFNCSFMYTNYRWAARQEDVKVVLNTRDPEKWVDSWLAVADGYDILSSRPFRWIKSVRDSLPVMEEAFMEIPTGGNPAGYLDRETLLAGYQIHTQNVVKAVPPERLLIYNVKQGWEPLCDFLELPVPDVPFPHINDRLKMTAVMTTMRFISWTWPLWFALPFYVFWRIMKRVFGGGKPSKSKTS